MEKMAAGLGKTLIACLFGALLACNGAVTPTGAGGPGGGNGNGNGTDGGGGGAPCTRSGAEVCDGQDNDCNGVIDDGVCDGVGKGDQPFPTDPSQHPQLVEVDGVGLDDHGDLALNRNFKQRNFLWIANTFDTLGSAKGCAYLTKAGYDPKLNAQCRGTVSKVDTATLKEVARYFTTTCHSTPGAAGCLDANGLPIVKDFPHAPSRTAVDYNFDVWVANRAFGGQPSATKIANNEGDCVDRNMNSKIDTSGDRDGDGKINVDCDADGKPDGLATKCTGTLAGKAPEFIGDDDECILFTTNYAEKNDLGRSICLNAGKATIGASDAWVGTFSRPGNKRGVNRYYKLNGFMGKIEATVDLPEGHNSYGCTADGHNVIWSTFGNGNVAFFNARSPYNVGPLLESPKKSKVTEPKAWQYGIATNADGHLWLGGSSSCRALRFKPDRTSFETLHKGTWTVFHVPCPGETAGTTTTTRGVAPDDRGKAWMALTSGYIVRIDQSLPDGEHDLTKKGDIWQLDAKGTIGVGVDFDGHVWGIGHSNSMASRLEVDAQGNVTNPKTKNVPVGHNPYTYSDFTGYGLINFVRPQGRYVYRTQPCPAGQRGWWRKVSWSATTPPGTTVSLRARSGETVAGMGAWVGPFEKPPADLEAAGLAPNPAAILEVEFTLQTADKTITPTLHEFGFVYDCMGNEG